MRLIRAPLSRLCHDEAGVALVLALVSMSVLALTTGALLLDGAANQNGTYRSFQDKHAFQLAQTALAYAEGITYAAGASHTSPPIGAQTLPPQPGGGTGTYSTSVGPDGYTWTMVGTGTVDGVTKTVSTQASVPGAVTNVDLGVWNYMYANDDSGAASQTCETTLQGGTVIDVPLLTRDNLCITGGGAYIGKQLEVGGNLTVSGSGYVGSAAKPVATLNIAGSPSSSACNNNGTLATPGTGVCDGTHASILASSVGTSLGIQPSMPALDLQSIYDYQASQTQSGCPAGLFDNNSTLDNSLSSTQLTSALFPSHSSYDCIVGPSEIKWSSPGSCKDATLTVKGILFFDGSISLGCGFQIIYSGQASMYFTGTVDIHGGDEFCGIADCTDAWNPDVNGVIFVAGCWANSTGSTLDTSGCVHFGGGANVQVGVYCTTNYQIDGGATNSGPVLADTLTITGGTSSLIPFHYMPPGTPLNSRTTYLPQSSPTHWSG